jgi:hypothetical protein
MATHDYIGNIIILGIYTFPPTPVQISYARFLNNQLQDQ